MADCIAVDPDYLAERSRVMRRLAQELEPSERRVRRQDEAFAAVGDLRLAQAGARFAGRWAIGYATLAERLREVSDRLDDAASAYAAIEELLAEAFR